jgi:cytochrome c oxidase subunit 4
MRDEAVIEDILEGGEHHAHEGEAFTGHEAMYVKIALLLAVLTAMEVAWPYLIDDGPVLMWPLLVMMSIKFAVIAAYFMHLKFDSIILTRIFYSGLFLAVGVYVVALTTLHVFGW